MIILYFRFLFNYIRLLIDSFNVSFSQLNRPKSGSNLNLFIFMIGII